MLASVRGHLQRLVESAVALDEVLGETWRPRFCAVLCAAHYLEHQLGCAGWKGWKCGITFDVGPGVSEWGVVPGARRVHHRHSCLATMRTWHPRTSIPRFPHQSERISSPPPLSHNRESQGLQLLASALDDAADPASSTVSKLLEQQSASFATFRRRWTNQLALQTMKAFRQLFDGYRYVPLGDYAHIHCVLTK